VIALVSGRELPIVVALVALAALALLGGLAAWTGGARLVPSIVRVTFWSALAMAITFAVGRMFHTQA
jgi:VIT1/CCC1 family predicted Fe2+/Mn2+ transporter